MKKAHGNRPLCGGRGGEGSLRPSLPLPSKKTPSNHPKGKKGEREGNEALSSTPPSLDLLKHNCNNNPSQERCFSCGRWTIMGRPIIGEEDWKYIRLGCKKWTCPFCGPKKAKRVRRAIIDCAVHRKFSRFLTLTLNPRFCNREESIFYIRECWKKFRIYIKRRCGKNLSFIAVLELQKSGYAHLHILIDQYLPQSWVSQAWQAVGGGQMVDIRYVDVHRIAGYVSKYLTKELLLAHNNGKYRRYTTSRDIVLFEKIKKGEWFLKKSNIEAIYYFLDAQVSETQIGEDGKLLSFSSTEKV